MQALHTLTSLFTAEYAIRPLLQLHPERTLQQMALWAQDPNDHVRRLVSERSRPRLPWAPRLPAFQANPTPVLDVLGFGDKSRMRIDEAGIVPGSKAIGAAVRVAFVLHNADTRTQQLLVELKVHDVKANESTSPKVFNPQVAATRGQRRDTAAKENLACRPDHTPPLFRRAPCRSPGQRESHCDRQLHGYRLTRGASRGRYRSRVRS